MSNSVKTFLLVVSSVILTLFFVELGLRAYQSAVNNVPFLSFLPKYKENRFSLSPFLVFGPRLDWQIPGKRYPEYAYFNSQGFRARALLGPKAPGELRVIALGGSTTENVWNEEGTHWPLELERHLHSVGRSDVRVYNGAMSAYSTAHSFVRFATDILPHEPDVLLIMHNINDLTVNYHALLAGKSVDPNYLVKYGRKEATGVIDEGDVVLSRVWHGISLRLRNLLAATEPNLPDQYDVEEGLNVFRRHLVSIDAVARAHGVRVVLLTMPLSRDPAIFEYTLANRRGRMDPLPAYKHFLRDVDRYNDAIRQVATGHDIAMVDMAKLLPQGKEQFADVVHYTTSGIKDFGRQLGHALVPYLDQEEF